MSKAVNKQFVGAVIRYTSRIVCLASLVGFGCIVASSLDSIRRTENVDVALEDMSRPKIPGILMPVAGHWSFAEAGLSIQKTRCSRSELDKLMDGCFESNSNLNYDASDLIDLAKTNGATSTKSPAGETWRHESDGIRFRLTITDSTPPYLKAAAIAMKDGDRWQLMTIKPKSTESGHLISLPVDSKTTCSRICETGALQMELVSVTETASNLLQRWRSEGWEIQHTPWGSADSFSYLCARDGEVVYAWSKSDDGPRTLMLTASSPETKHSTQQERD